MGKTRCIELQCVSGFATHYREKRLPDDDAGRADLRMMADHLAQIDPLLIRSWAATWMPILTSAELDALVEHVGTGKRWKADALARELSLDDATRARLKIKTIGAVDCSKTKRKIRRRRKRIAADRARRAKAGARPHALSAENLMPWIEAGISRATYYRRRRAQIAASETVETEMRPIVRSTSIASGSADPERLEHGAEARTFDAKHLPLRFRVGGPSDQDEIAEAVGLDDVSFRAAHLERFTVQPDSWLKALPTTPFPAPTAVAGAIVAAAGKRGRPRDPGRDRRAPKAMAAYDEREDRDRWRSQADRLVLAAPMTTLLPASRPWWKRPAV